MSTGTKRNNGERNLSLVGGLIWNHPRWGSVLASWPLVRMILDPSGVRFEPSFWRHFGIARIPNIELLWADIRSVQFAPGLTAAHLAFEVKDADPCEFLTHKTFEEIVALLGPFDVVVQRSGKR